MDYKALKHLSIDEYEELIDQEMDRYFGHGGTDLSCVDISAGHSDIHFHSEMNELLDRIAMERKNSVSCFNSHEDAIENIANLVMFNSKEIASWFHSDPNKHRFDKDYWTKEISLDMGEYAGYGIRNFEECQTTAVKVVLQRDPHSGASPLGFYVKTAYPDLERDDCLIRTGRFYTREFIANNRDCFENVIQKVEFLYRSIPSSMQMSYYRDQVTDEPTLAMTYKNTSDMFRIYVDENSVNIKRYFPTREKMTMEQFRAERTHEAKFLERIIETRDTLLKGKAVTPEQVRGIHQKEANNDRER